MILNWLTYLYVLSQVSHLDIGITLGIKPEIAHRQLASRFYILYIDCHLLTVGHRKDNACRIKRLVIDCDISR